MVEPADNVLQAFHSMPRLARARKLVGFIWEPHHHRWNFPKLEGAEHLFAARAGRGAEIGFADYKHQRRLYIFNVGDRRARSEILFFIERRPLEPEWLKQSKIGCVPPVGPVRDVALRHAGGKTSGVANRPVG